MTITEFMTSKIANIQIIIKNLDSPFKTHDFIEKFKKEFELNYVNFLGQYKDKNAHFAVHTQIGKFLSNNSTTLRIQKTNKVSSKNVFGKINLIQQWIKL